MLIRKPQVHIVSKEISLPTGELVRAFFAIVEIEGVREIKFLGTKPVQNQEAECVLCLAAPKVSRIATSIVSYFEDLFLPFASLDLLVNQLARAPSRA